MASAAAPPDAIDAVADLKPNLVVAETSAAQAGGGEVVAALRRDDATKNVPIILLTDAGRVGLGSRVTPEVDLILVKPVQPEMLLARVAELLAWSKALRARSRKTSTRAARLLEKSNELIDRAARIKAEIERTNRPCPSCGGALEWLERGTLGGIEYDYYRWCHDGCGLFCYDLTRPGTIRWIKLA